MAKDLHPQGKPYDSANVPDFPSHGEIRKRLQNVIQPAVTIFAARCALRVLPLLYRAGDPFASRKSFYHIVALSEMVEAAIKYSVAGQEITPSIFGAANVAIHAFGSTDAAALAAASSAYSAASSATRATLATIHASNAAFAAYTSVGAYAKRRRDRPLDIPPLTAFRDSILADLSWLEKEPETTGETLHRFILAPLFSTGAAGVDLAAYLRPWREALLVQTRKEKYFSRGAEAVAIAKRIEDYFHGHWDWVTLLGPDLAKAHGLAGETPLVEPLAVQPSSLLASEFSTLLVRLAYRNPAALILAEAPTREAFERLVSAEQRADPHAFAVTLARETGDFAPDPLWLAWIQAAQPAFFDTLAVVPGSAPWTGETGSSAADEEKYPPARSRFRALGKSIGGRRKK